MNAHTPLDRRSFGFALLLLASSSGCESSQAKSKKSGDDDDGDGSERKKKKKGKSSTAAEESSKATAGDPLAGFVKYASARGKYEIMFPTKPTEKITRAEPPLIYQVRCDIGEKGYYTAQHTDFAELGAGAKELTAQDKKEVFEASWGAFAKKMNGTNERRMRFTVEGNEGSEVAFDTKEQGAMRIRDFWIGKRKITLITGGLTAAESDAFFASFKTTK